MEALADHGEEVEEKVHWLTREGGAWAGLVPDRWWR